MKSRYGRIAAVVLVVALGACTSTPNDTETTASVEPSAAAVASASPSEQVEAFPIAAFAQIREDPVPRRAAAELQAILDEMAGRAGMAATVMTADGTWSVATGKADDVRDVRVDDQFAIASVTKSVVAAQVMQMVEAGELDLDDPAAEHLPPELDFDTNDATIRHLLSQRSGIPDYFDAVQASLSPGRRRVWTPADLLEMAPTDRTPAGGSFNYTNVNYLLLGLVIEQVRGRPLAQVLRDGVLDTDGVGRLIYQPDEVPTEPMAMPEGASTEIFETGGGYLPTLEDATADGAAAAMATDSPSLAHWWRAFCAGEIVSEASLTEMTSIHDGYGLTVRAGPPRDRGAWRRARGIRVPGRMPARRRRCRRRPEQSGGRHQPRGRIPGERRPRRLTFAPTDVDDRLAVWPRRVAAPRGSDRHP